MNPIPKFDHNNVLPPHLGDPREPGDLSPYECTSLEICERFATSSDRIIILKGLINFRLRMVQEGILQGFQWLDGSFLENIELIESRSPRDLDIVTFYGGLTIEFQENLLISFPEFIYTNLAKRNYMLDHYPVDYCISPDLTVENTRYWIQLFSHNRLGVWKGIIRLQLNTPNDDKEALNYLSGL